MSNFKCTIEETGFWLEFSDYKLFISHDCPGVTWDAMKERAEAAGGLLPSWDQAVAIGENSTEINKQLKAAGKPEIAWEDHCWTNREYSTDARFAWFVDMGSGNTYYHNKSNTYYVRAVSAFQLKNLKS